MSNTEAAQILDQSPATPAPIVTPSGVSTDAAPLPQQDDKLASKLEILLKREQQIVERDNIAKAKEKELEAKLARIAEFESAKNGNYKKALELLGTDYDSLTQSMLQDGSIPPEAQIKKLDEKFEQFKTEQQKQEEARLAQAQKDAQDKEQQVIQGFKGEITQYLKDNTARYELIGFEEQEDLVFSVIDEHYNRTLNPETGIGKIMSIKEAADKVELFLEQKYERSRNVGKIKSLWGMLPQPAKKQIEQVASKKTLSNNLTASQAAPQARAPLSDEERVQRAIAYAKGLRPDVR